MFEKGHDKLGGRAKGTPNKWSYGKFQEEFDRDKEKYNGQSIYEYFYMRARENDVVLIALMRKLLPDLRQIEAIIEHSDNEWADKTPSEIVDDMDSLTTGDE